MYISAVLTQVSVKSWWPPGICIFPISYSGLCEGWWPPGICIFPISYSGLSEGLMASWYMYISRLLLRSLWRVWWPPGICIFLVSYSGLCGGLMASKYLYISLVLTQVSVKGWWPPGICIFLLYLPRSLCRVDSLQVYVYFCCTYSGICEGLMASWYMYISRLLLRSLWRVMASWYMYISRLLLRSLWRVDGLQVYVYFSCTYSGLCAGLIASRNIFPVLTHVSVKDWWPPGICIFLLYLLMSLWRIDGLQVYVYFSCTYSGLCEGLMASRYMYISSVLTQASMKSWWPPGICIFLLYLLRSLWRVDDLLVYVYFSCTYSGLCCDGMLASRYMYISPVLLRSLWRVDGLLVYVYFSSTYSGLCEGLMASWYMYIYPVPTQVSVKGWWPPGICLFLLYSLRSLWRVDGLLVYVYFSCTYSGLCEGLMASWYMYISPVLTQVSVKGWWPPGICIFLLYLLRSL